MSDSKPDEVKTPDCIEKMGTHVQAAVLLVSMYNLAYVKKEHTLFHIGEILAVGLVKKFDARQFVDYFVKQGWLMEKEFVYGFTDAGKAKAEEMKKIFSDCGYNV